MTASRKTIRDTAETIRDWQRSVGLSDKDIRWLLESLGEIKGNSSFTSTIRLIREFMFEEEHK